MSRQIQLTLPRRSDVIKMEKPGEDASAAEIARWLEADFMDSVAEGIDEALDEDDEEEAESTATDDTEEE